MAGSKWMVTLFFLLSACIGFLIQLQYHFSLSLYLLMKENNLFAVFSNVSDHASVKMIETKSRKKRLGTELEFLDIFSLTQVIYFVFYMISFCFKNTAQYTHIKMFWSSNNVFLWI